jgi:predicted regulator of Ras-like GTPase activity (Roadblock/LC7/MglB family)
MSKSPFDEISDGVRGKIPGFRALAFVGLDGNIEDLTIADPEFSTEALPEFAMLFRIAHRTSEDTRTGELSEMTWKSDRSIVVMSRVSDDSFLILFGTDEVRTGQARYVLRNACRRLALGTQTPAGHGRT